MTVFLLLAWMAPLPTVEANLDRVHKPASGRPATPDGIIHADVLARTELLREELEAIRFEMGKPKISQRERVATNAAPHEVYFQAITLFLKADRLALELTGSTGLRPKGVSIREVRPFHVWRVVDAAYDRVLVIKQELGIQESLVERPRNPSTTATDAGTAILMANRQINLMLERRFTASDVFQQVTIATRYAANLLRQFPDVTTMPKAPPFERGKEPRDVLARLVDCYKILEMIAVRSRVEVLHLDADAVRRITIHPSEVYDMATLLVSDLAYVHAHLRDVKPPGVVSYPGRKFPSHVYQQAGLLRAQLISLEQQVKARPDWLNP